jgi:BASS family bile acid:Na+ symporter
MDPELLAQLSRASTLAFAVTTMFAMGLGLTVRQILAPLRNWRFVVAAIAVNFVVVPLAALLLAEALGLSEDLRIGLVLVAVAAGAPMVPKLTQIAKGDAVSAVALVTLLIAATVVLAPMLLVLLLPEADVASGQMAVSLSGQMLLPLAAGLFVRARYEEEALAFGPTVGVASTISLVLVFLFTVGQNLSGLLGLIGTGGIFAIIVLIAVAIVSGFLLAVPARVERRVMALGAAQRNLAAAFIVANSSFVDRSDTVIYIATVGLVSMVLLFPVAGEFSRRPRGDHLPPNTDTEERSRAAPAA